jgi:hypothetical protein
MPAGALAISSTTLATSPKATPCRGLRESCAVCDDDAGPQERKELKMALRLYDLVPIDDIVLDEESLVERVFGPNFYVMDETGRCLTTVRNQRLLAGARELLGRDQGDPTMQHAQTLADLRRCADFVTQQDYQRAFARDFSSAWQPTEFDHTRAAGSLE